MQHPFRRVLFPALTVLVLAACGNDDGLGDGNPPPGNGNPPPGGGVGGVYVAGRVHDGITGYQAVLWKDGEVQNLSQGSPHAEARSVTVSGDDVYVAGAVADGNNKWVATLWKNGQAQPLTDGSRDAVATAVAASGDRVYVAGYIHEQTNVTTRAVLWVDGTMHYLTDDTEFSKAEAHSVAVRGDLVYVAGWDHKLSDGDSRRARVWVLAAESGVVVLADEYVLLGNHGTSSWLHTAYAHSLAWGKLLLGNGQMLDYLFIAGYSTHMTGDGPRADAMLWQPIHPVLDVPFMPTETVQHGVDPERYMALSVAVPESGPGAYAAGWGTHPDNGHPVAMLWYAEHPHVEMNAVRLSEAYSLAHGVAVFGSGVYVAGMLEGEAALWTSGVPQKLTSGSVVASEAFSVFVK